MSASAFAAVVAMLIGLGTPSSAVWPSPASAPAGIPATISKIVDGDTVYADTGPRSEKVRIRGIDTPETRKPGTPIQCGGPEATQFARQMLQGHRVTLVTDPGDLRDRYNRLVAEVWLPDGRSYAFEAVRAGMGKAYVFDAAHPASNRDQIAAAEHEAQVAHRGMWGHCAA